MAQSLRSASRRKSESFTSSPAYTIPSAKAIRLVYCDENGVFRMDAEAVSALQLVKGPLGVVSVCGRARQGKSFILNQLLGRSSGFQVASTHRPCTKGLWMWSTPIKRTAPDGTEYNLLLLDTEGIDAYDQTGTYSTQIFSLAVLLSSMFIYNQMGGIDEAALDKLSLVTEMTKHIQVKSCDHRPSISELGQFTPVFLWLLRDFYLDLTEEDKRISPKDYLEAALQPVSGHGSDVAAKNKIRDSILGLFPDRDCFTLVRPLNSERELQRLNQIPVEKLRPEFRAGLDALTKLIFERAKPKQLGSVVLTGPILIGLTQSFLDAINAGAVPTIATSWQNVEESECRRAHDAAMDVYLSAFKDSALDNEEKFRRAHESSVQDAMNTYNSEAVGFGAARQKYEKLLVAALKRHFEENLNKLILEGEVKCAKALEKMDEKLWAVCQSSDVSLSEVFQVFGDLVTNYDETTHGPTKFKKFVKFLHHSFEGPLLAIAKRNTNQTIAESTGHQMKVRSLEDKLANAEKQLEAAKRDSIDWKKRYESVFEENKSSDTAFSSQYMALQKSYNTLEENYNHVLHQSEIVRKEASEWRTQYECAISERNAGEEQLTVEIRALQSRCSAAEGRLAAAREQLESLKEEAEEWRRKYEAATEEADSTSESAKVTCDRLSKQYQAREDALREEFQSNLSDKEKETKDAQTKLEQVQRQMSSLQSQLEDYQMKCNAQEDEISRLKLEVKSTKSSMDKFKSNFVSLEKEVEILKKENSHLEGKLSVESKKVEELHEKCNNAESNLRLANERANKAWEEAKIARKQKLESDRIAAERLAAHENAERRCESLARENEDLLKEVEKLQAAEEDTVTKVRSLDKHLEERDKEMEELLDSAHKQRANSTHVLETLLASERQACAEANSRAEALSVQLQTIQSKLDALQQEFSTSRLNESLLDGKLRIRQGKQTSLTTPSPPAKRLREDNNGGDESIHDINVEATNHASRKKPYNLILDNGSSPTQSQCDTPGNLDNTTPTSEVEDPDSHAHFSISRLRHELTSSGFGDELQRLRNPTKRKFFPYMKNVYFRKS